MTRRLPQSRREARRLLGAELRRLRTLAGLSSAAMAAVIGKSVPTVSRIEAGDRAIAPEQVQAWLAAVRSGAPGALSAKDSEYLERLTGRATTEISPLSGTLAARQATTAGIEAAATAIRNWQPSYVPGLLQTPDYARAVFASIKPPAQVEAAVAGRIARQAVLGDSSRRFEFITTEQGLGWRPGGADPRPAQLDRVASVAALPHVAVRVIPFGAVMHVPPVGPFVLYEGDDDAAQVHVELPDQEVWTSDVKGYQDDLALLRRSALADGEAAAFIRNLAARL